MRNSEYLAKDDPQIMAAINCELERQRLKLEMIASENFASRAVLAASGSPLMNKYAEGYCGRRYYGGCEHVDTVEELAIVRAKKIFGADHVNVQPHSGSQANMAACFAVLSPGETILGLNLSHGGHLTHGSKVNFSGRLYYSLSYGVNPDTELIDYEQLLKLAAEHKPRVIMAGASSYSRIIDFGQFREAARLAGATLIVDMAHFAGLVAAGLYPNPVDTADIVTSTTHKTLRGPRGGMIMCRMPLAKAIDAQVFPGIQGGPLMNIIAAKAVAFNEALAPEFIDYQRQVVKNAQRLSMDLNDSGFRIVSGGTDTHLLLVDLRNKNITGDCAEKVLDEAGITANKNAIPYDPNPPQVTSGLRLGTPALTTRGFQEAEMDQTAEFIVEALKKPDSGGHLKKIRQKVQDLCRKFPLYPEE